MKNLKKLFLGLLFLILPVLVLADAGGPTFTEYDVRVKNPNGTYVEKWNYEIGKNEKIHVPYDTIIKRIMYEETIDGKLYGYSEDGNVLLEDCEAITTDFDFSKFNDAKGKFYVYKEGAYLYKGPSKIYGKVDNEIMIPVGTIIEYKYSDGLFAYVTYNGTSGWVYYYQVDKGEVSGPYKEGSSLATIESGEIYTLKDTIVYNDPVDGQKTNMTIPSGQKIKYKYTYSSTPFVRNYYVTYNGTSGWIINENNNVANILKDAKVFTYNYKTNICEILSDNCKKIVGSIPANTMLDIDYMLDSFVVYIHVTYNGVAGWLYLDEFDEKNFRVSYGVDNYSIKVDKKIYDSINGKETTKEIKAGEVLAHNFYIWDNENYWLYLPEYNGWFKVKDGEYEILEPIIKEEKTENNDVITKVNIKQLIVYLVGGAIVLSLTTIVTINLINRKKEEKND